MLDLGGRINISSLNYYDIIQSDIDKDTMDVIDFIRNEVSTIGRTGSYMRMIKEDIEDDYIR